MDDDKIDEVDPPDLAQTTGPGLWYMHLEPQPL